MVTGFAFLSRLTQIAPPFTRFVFLGAGFRLGLPSHPASRRRSCLRLGVSTTSSSRGLSPPSDRPCRAYSRRRLRRRWPGVSAGLGVEDARPAHAESYSGRTRSSIRLIYHAGRSERSHLPRPLLSQLVASASLGGTVGRRTRSATPNHGPSSYSQGLGPHPPPWRPRRLRVKSAER